MRCVDWTGGDYIETIIRILMILRKSQNESTRSMLTHM